MPIWIPVREFIPHGGAALHLEISIIMEKQCVKHLVHSLSLCVLEHIHANSTRLQESTFAHYYWLVPSSFCYGSMFFEWNVLVVRYINCRSLVSVWILGHMSDCTLAGSKSRLQLPNNRHSYTLSQTHMLCIFGPIMLPFFRSLHPEMNTWPDLQSDHPPSKHLFHRLLFPLAVSFWFQVLSSSNFEVYGY